MSGMTRDGTAEPVSRDQILRLERGQGINRFACLADHEQDWQPHPFEPYSIESAVHTYIYAYIQLYIQSYIHVCFLPIHSGHQVRWTYQPGSHRRKVTQDF